MAAKKIKAEAPPEDELEGANQEADRWQERMNQAEAALLREYHYHMLRAEELRDFLSDRGHGFPGFD